MAKQTRKTATKRTTTGRGRGGGGVQSMGYGLNKQDSNRLGKLWNGLNKSHQKSTELIQQLKTEFGPIMKAHGFELEGATQQRRTATRKTGARTRARTGSNTQTERQAATA